MNKFDKQKIVKDFLLYPINITKRKQEIAIYNNTIQTGQKYYSRLDPDMSNIAIEFYKIIYSKKDILNNRQLADKNFAGDTMCSFKTIKRKTFKFEGKETDYLKKYHEQYHCLANFWMLPLKEGRAISGKMRRNKIDDYMDRYLIEIKNNNDYFEKYESYCDLFNSFENFCKNHFLNDAYVKNNEIVLFSNKKTPKEIINAMIDLIEKRAEVISKSDYCDKLFVLYEKYSKNK